MNLHQKFVEYGRNAKQWMRKCQLLLPEIQRHQTWKKHGFENIYDYARKLAGMSTNSVNEALRVLRKAEDKPEIMEVIRKKGLNAAKPIITVATKGTAKFWSEKAMNMSKNTLETYVREFREQKSLPRKEKRKITIELDTETANQIEKLSPAELNELIRSALKEREEKLETEKPQPQKATSRAIPTKIKKFVLRRSNGICEATSCKKQYYQLHHTKRFALDKRHDSKSIVALCKAHNDIAHTTLIENEDAPAAKWRVLEKSFLNDMRHIIDWKVQKYRTRAIGAT